MRTSIDATDHELEVLESIYSRAEHVRQRDLARIAGLSLGMVNAIVKRLVQKGWLTIRKLNNRNIRYAVSASGIDQITRRSYRYLRRTVKNIVYYRESIEEFISQVRTEGYRKVVLVGRSDLDFIVEHACGLSQIEFVRDDRIAEQAGEPESGVFLLYAETYIPDEEEKRGRPGASFLQEVVGVKLTPQGAAEVNASD